MPIPKLYHIRDAQNSTHIRTAHLVEWSTLARPFRKCIISEMHKITHTSGQHTSGTVTACTPIPKLYHIRDAQNNTHIRTAHLVEWSTLARPFQSCIISEMHKTTHTHLDSTPCEVVTACTPIPKLYHVRDAQNNNTHIWTAHLAGWSQLARPFQSCIISEMHKTTHTP